LNRKSIKYFKNRNIISAQLRSAIRGGNVANGSIVGNGSLGSHGSTKPEKKPLTLYFRVKFYVTGEATCKVVLGRGKSSKNYNFSSKKV
jgi:hypothetical protein